MSVLFRKTFCFKGGLSLLTSVPVSFLGSLKEAQTTALIAPQSPVFPVNK